MDWFAVSVYLGLCAVLALYGLHRYHLLYLYSRHRRARAAAVAPPRPLPPVCVQLPIYNERYVVERLLRAVANLDYPRDRLTIQLLDDSTDDTTEIAARVIEELRAKGVRIAHLRRADRTGYKAGALQYGLAHDAAPYVAVFDADFLPSPDFLLRTLGYFEDPGVGMVQVCWGHLNRDQSVLTRLQSILLDGHFVIESAARHRSGRLFNFNGTAGLWRRSAIEAAGGWQHDTLTEDLDLSYRAQMAGWRFVYVDRFRVPAEVPTTMAAFKAQQHRWAKGSIQTARKLLGPIFASTLSVGQKVEAFFHLTANFNYLLLVFLSLSMFPAMHARLRLEAVLDPAARIGLDVALFAAATVSVVAFYVVSQRQAYRRWWDRILYVPFVLSLGIGMSVSQSRAVLEALRGPVGEFRRTPKSGGARHGAAGRYRLGLSPSVAGELAFAAAFAWLGLRLVASGLWAPLPFVALFGLGFGYVGLSSLMELRPRRSGAAL